MPQGIDVSIRHYLLTLKDLGIYSAPLQKQGSLSLRRCWDGREDLGSLRKKVPVGPSFQQPSIHRLHAASFLQMPKQIFSEECLEPGRTGENAISSYSPAITEVLKAFSISLPFSSPSHPSLNLEVPMGSQLLSGGGTGLSVGASAPQGSG